MEKRERIEGNGTINRGISSSVLKWVAILTMLVDHLDSGLIDFGILSKESGLSLTIIEKYSTLSSIMHGIGRIAFPIFVFLLVEGFYLTSNRKKMSLRLIFFALLSEVPFDLNFFNSPIYYLAQNVFFTLFLGFLGMWSAESIKKKYNEKKILSYLFQFLAFLPYMILAEIMRTDYASLGIFAIMIFYFLRGGARWKRLVATILGFNFEAGTSFFRALGLSFDFPAVYLAAIPIYLYNGKRGRQNKYFFYFFYPIHLFMIYLIRRYYIF